MSKVVNVFVVCLGVWCMLLSVCMLFTFSDSDRMNQRMDAVVEERDMLLEKVLMMDMELSQRDSMVMVEIGKSERRLVGFMKARAESWVRAQELEDSIGLLRQDRDSLAKTFLKF